MSDVERHIAEKLLPALRSVIVEQLGEPAEGKWSLEIDANDRQTVNFHYPTALFTTEYEGMAYITPRVKLELGARGDPWPTERKAIRPYAADDFPDFFKEPDSIVTVLSRSEPSGKRQLRFMPRHTVLRGQPPLNISRGTIMTSRCFSTPKREKPQQAISMFWQPWQSTRQRSFGPAGPATTQRSLPL